MQFLGPFTRLKLLFIILGLIIIFNQWKYRFSEFFTLLKISRDKKQEYQKKKFFILRTIYF